MAEESVEDASKLYREGDVVKAKVLKVNSKAGQISLGLKPSYFDGEDGGDAGSDMDISDTGSALAAGHGRDNQDVVTALAGDRFAVSGGDLGEASSAVGSEDDVMMKDLDMDSDTAGRPDELVGGGFDWSTAALDEPRGELKVSGDDDGSAPRRKPRNKAAMRREKAGEQGLDSLQTAGDFEMRLEARRDDSSLWVQYMAFHAQAGELGKAREIAERAIKSIPSQEETELLHLWVAYINLEASYGSEATEEAVMQRACQRNDEQEMHKRLASIYIRSGRSEKASQQFEAMIRKFGAKSPSVWTNYGHFVYHVLEAPEQGRALLARGMQTLDKSHHVSLTEEFAALEMRSAKGSPERGRTLFEGLLAVAPRKFDLWNRRLDLEEALFRAEKAKGTGGEADAAAVRDVFERGAKATGPKARPARRWFERWDKWEKENGDAKSREKVLARAKQVVLEAASKKGL